MLRAGLLWVILATFLGYVSCYGVDFLSAADFVEADKLTAEEVYGKHIPVEVVNDYRSDIREPLGVRRRSKIYQTLQPRQDCQVVVDRIGMIESETP
ncbi:hypothetical protein NECAME_17653 [Necator americanus]|uniref:Uncharacterized protein n=1 Tax=Necator americanus TaxID=51031 RepID=W2TNN6_NECAM|nr:hypothetical protein NECAME_17653 [Necator americanus]ETN82736.1 hypothetical protein NECAME_17653 [Necator americanus]